LREPAPFLSDALEKQWPSVRDDIGRVVEMAVKGQGKQPDDDFLRYFHEVFGKAVGGVLAILFPVKPEEAR
jgi:hypothetical protein